MIQYHYEYQSSFLPTVELSISFDKSLSSVTFPTFLLSFDSYLVLNIDTIL